MGIFWFDISYKALIDPEPLHIGFNKIDGFIKIYDGTRYLTLFGSEKYDAIYDRIRYLTNLKYLMNLKTSITYIFSHYFAKTEVDSYDSLLIEKMVTLHNVIIQIKSVLNKNGNLYYSKIFLEKCLYQLAKK